jgi:hypothetical protein
MPDPGHIYLKGAAMIRNFVVVCAVLSLCLVAFGQERGDAPKAEIFGGYQYLHVSTGLPDLGVGLGSFNLNGWNASASAYFNRNLGVTADFGGNYGSPLGANARFYSFLFGPSVRFPNSSRVTPFAHALFGGGHFSADAGGINILKDTGFTWAAGGGFDVGVTPHFGVRLAQADFLQSRLLTLTQNNFRYSAGIVLKF